MGVEVDGSAIQGVGEHAACRSVWAARVRVTDEIDAQFGAGEGNQGVGWGKESGELVKEDDHWFVEGETLTGADGESSVANVVDGLGARDGVGEVDFTKVVAGGGGDAAFLFVEGLDVEEAGKVLGDAIRPPAVQVDVRREAGGLGGEEVVG